MERKNLNQPVDFLRVGIFLLFTFVLSWSFSLFISPFFGQDILPETGLTPLDMFLPAVVALGLQVFIFRDSQIYFRSYRGKPRWIFHCFFLLVILYGIITGLAFFTRIPLNFLSAIGNLLVTCWTLLVFFLYGKCGEKEFKRAGLQLGNPDRAIKILAGVWLFLLLQPGLNLFFHLGELPGGSQNIAGIPTPPRIYPVALILYLIVISIGTPLAGLAVTFGEEYGWRWFLQKELTKLGPRRGILLIGLIWGVWHFPIILKGIHTFPPNGIGLLLGLLFFVLWGYVQSFAVLKTGSIWVAVFLHGMVNSVYTFTLTYLGRPYSKIQSFGLGLYGIGMLAVIVFFLLRDPIWCTGKQSDETR